MISRNHHIFVLFLIGILMCVSSYSYQSQIRTLTEQNIRLQAEVQILKEAGAK